MSQKKEQRETGVLCGWLREEGWRWRGEEAALLDPDLKTQGNGHLQGLLPFRGSGRGGGICR